MPLVHKDMNRFLVLSLLALFCAVNNFSCISKSEISRSQIRQAERVIAEQGGGKNHVTIQTSLGKIVVVLYDDTPAHRDNFLQQVQAGTYTGVLFHRVIKDFMIQAGDPTSKFALATARYGGTSAGEDVPPEIRRTLFHHKGALAAARAGDDVNPGKYSSGSQFYIVVGSVQSDSTLQTVMQQKGITIPEDQQMVYRTVGGTPHLDGEYTVFGRIIRGQRVLDKIAARPTDFTDRPRRDIYIRSMTVKVRK